MRKVNIFYLLGFLVGGATGLFIPLSSLFLSEKNIPENVIGMISATYFAAMVIGSYVFLKICKKFDAYKLVIAALFGAILSIIAFVKADSLPMYFLCMFMIGLGISFNFITIQNGLSQSDVEDKTRITGLYAFFFAMGFACSTACGTSLFTKSANLAFGIACFLLAIDMGIIFKIKIKLNFTENEKERYNFWVFAPFILGGFTYGFIENAFSSFYNIYLKHFYSINFSGIVLGAFVLGGIIGMLPLSALPKKVGIHKACIVFSAGALIGFGLILVTDYKLIFSVVAGACVCVIYPSTLAALNLSEVSRNEIVWATGVYSIFYSIGSAFGPFIAGFATSITSVGLFIVSGLLMLLFGGIHLHKAVKMS